MDFAHWDYARQKQTKTQTQADSNTLPQNEGSVEGVLDVDSSLENDDNATGEVSRYVWPDFILTMLKRPTDWASWRKRVERSISAQKDIGKSSSNASIQDNHALIMSLIFFVFLRSIVTKRIVEICYSNFNRCDDRLMASI